MNLMLPYPKKIDILLSKTSVLQKVNENFPEKWKSILTQKKNLRLKLE